MNTIEPLKCVIVDDEPKAAELLADLLKRLPFIGEVKSYHEPHQSMLGIVREVPDLVFIDQRMPDLSGIDLIKELNKMQVKTSFVMVTGFDDSILEALREGVVDYLMTPVQESDLLQMLHRYFKLRKDRESGAIPRGFNGEVLRFNTLNGFFLVRLDEIVLIRAHGNYSDMTLNTDEHKMVTCSMGKMEEYLPSQWFFKADRSHLINLLYLREVNRKKQICYLGHNSKKWEVGIARQHLSSLARRFLGKEEIVNGQHSNGGKKPD